jgi:hypothetical protein
VADTLLSPTRKVLSNPMSAIAQELRESVPGSRTRTFDREAVLRTSSREDARPIEQPSIPDLESTDVADPLQDVDFFPAYVVPRGKTHVRVVPVIPARAGAPVDFVPRILHRDDTDISADTEATHWRPLYVDGRGRVHDWKARKDGQSRREDAAATFTADPLLARQKSFAASVAHAAPPIHHRTFSSSSSSPHPGERPTLPAPPASAAVRAAFLADPVAVFDAVREERGVMQQEADDRRAVHARIVAQTTAPRHTLRGRESVLFLGFPAEHLTIATAAALSP